MGKIDCSKNDVKIPNMVNKTDIELPRRYLEMEQIQETARKIIEHSESIDIENALDVLIEIEKSEHFLELYKVNSKKYLRYGSILFGAVLSCAVFSESNALVLVAAAIMVINLIINAVRWQIEYEISFTNDRKKETATSHIQSLSGESSETTFLSSADSLLTAYHLLNMNIEQTDLIIINNVQQRLQKD